MYNVSIDNFDGPLDLLLSLIKEAKMNIFDIKLEVIIDKYLDYIKKMNELNLNIASSYLVMASELIEIKSKMLLPKNSEEEEIDYKENLINRLISYQQYKDQIEKFKELEMERSNYYTKIPCSLSDFETNEKTVLIDNINIDDLTNAFKKFLDRMDNEKPLNTKITRKELSVDDSIKDIRMSLKKHRRMNFFDLFNNKDREHYIVTFLAVLELAFLKEIRLIQENNFDNIICEEVNGK